MDFGNDKYKNTKGNPRKVDFHTTFYYKGGQLIATRKANGKTIFSPDVGGPP